MDHNAESTDTKKEISILILIGSQIRENLLLLFTDSLHFNPAFTMDYGHQLDIFVTASQRSMAKVTFPFQ